MSGRLLDKRRPDGSYPFEYRDSANTDITRTWAKARQRMEEEKAKRDQIIRRLPQRCPK
jgi:hypothetical protein